MDLVGALEFDHNDVWLAKRSHPGALCPQGKSSWYAVPKPIKTLVKTNNRDWISSFADLERVYMQHTQKMKNLIRIFKVQGF